jgi:hypothetical protein
MADGPDGRITMETSDSLEIIHTPPPPPPTERTRQRQRTILAAAAAAGVLVLGGAAVVGWQLTHSSPSATPGPSGAALPAIDRAAPDRITVPAAGNVVVSGVLVQGVARDLKAGDALWLFDHDPSGGYIRDNKDPMPVTDGQWSFRDNDLTSGPLQLVLVKSVAGSKCATSVARMIPNSDGTFYTDQLPDGCSPVQQVSVTVR